MIDAHCHPWDLRSYSENSEEERRKTKTSCAANSWNIKQFEYHENLALKAMEDGAPRIYNTFALHPQLSPFYLESPKEGGDTGDNKIPSLVSGLGHLQSLAMQGRLHAVGETGFDLYDERYRGAEKIQDEMFHCHLEIALKYSLPMILHVRRAMHKIFPYSRDLKNLPAVIFHSWPGTKEDGESLIRRGINVFFSLGSGVLLNHKKAIASAANFPPGRILLETDAPYQPLRGNNFSSWRDLEQICQGIAAIRKEAGVMCNTKDELEEQTTASFMSIFEPPS